MKPAKAFCNCRLPRSVKAAAISGAQVITGVDEDTLVPRAGHRLHLEAGATLHLSQPVTHTTGSGCTWKLRALGDMTLALQLHRCNAGTLLPGRKHWGLGDNLTARSTW